MRSSSFGVPGRVISLQSDLEVDARSRRALRAQPSRRDTAKRVAWWVATVLCCLAFWQFSSAGWIHAKAVVAQHLIAKSWSQARESGVAQRPWPWADTYPVARLTVAGRNIALIILEGASGRSLAFGPGHVSGTAAPGSAGNSVIVAHKDTHFAFLRELANNEEISIEDAKGAITRYRVREVAVVERDDTRVMDAADSTQLTLITCFPFEAITPGTTQRYVVIADRIA